MVDRCVCCGAVIPEGTEVCINCRYQYLDQYSESLAAHRPGHLRIPPLPKQEAVISIKCPADRRAEVLLFFTGFSETKIKFHHFNGLFLRFFIVFFQNTVC